MECVYKKTGFILYKLIPCLMIIMYFFMCLYGSSVYAFSSTVDDTTYEVPDFYSFVEYEYQTLLYDPNSVDYNYILLDSSTPLSIVSKSTNSSHHEVYGFRNADSSNLNVFRIPVGSTSWEAWMNSYANIYIPTRCEFVYANNDIYYNNELVFQAPLQTPTTIVASQVGGTEMNKILQEILGILPTVLVVIVGILAIRKGIQFLMAIMKKA